MSKRTYTEAEIMKKFWEQTYPVLPDFLKTGKVTIVNIAPYSGNYFYDIWMGNKVQLNRFKPLLISWDKERYERLYSVASAADIPTK